MTKQVSLTEAKASLSQLLDAAVAGQDVVIAKAGGPAVRLVPVAAPPKRILGFFPLTVDDALADWD